VGAVCADANLLAEALLPEANEFANLIAAFRAVSHTTPSFALSGRGTVVNMGFNAAFDSAEKPGLGGKGIAD